MTASSAVPALIDQLVTLALATVPAGAHAYDGYPTTSNPSDYLAIGVDDPDATDWSNSGESDVQWAGTGSGAAQEERGAIHCAAIAWDGAQNAKKARDNAYAMKDALGAAIRQTPLSLGLANVAWSLGSRNQYRSAQTDEGAVALVLFDIYFLARL